jgi:hypothetical protein
MNNDLNPVPQELSPDAPIQAFIKNKNYPNGQLVFASASLLNKMTGVITDPERVMRLIKARVDIDNPGPPPRYILEFGNMLETFPVLSLGNISTIQGKAKARKGWLAVLLAAKIMKDKKIEGKSKIILVDTEQAKPKVAQVANRIRQLSGKGKEDIITLTARANSMAEKLELIEDEMMGREDILLVIIDGIVDLVTGANEEKEAKLLIEGKLMPLSTILDCHIVCIIHENKRDGFARGFLGLILAQKGEAVFIVEKDGPISKVTPGDNREIDFPEMAFEIKDDLPYFIDGYNPEPVKVPNKKKSQQDYPVTTLDKIIDNIFDKGGEKIHSPKFRELLKLELQGFGIKPDGKDAVNLWITYCESTYKKIVAVGDNPKALYYSPL